MVEVRPITGNFDRCSFVTWFDKEQNLPSVARQQMRRIVVRARHKWGVTVGLTLVIAAALFAKQARRPSLYEAEVGLVIMEGSSNADRRPLSQGEVSASITRALFAPDQMEGLIARHDLVKKLGGSNPGTTADRVKKLTQIETFHDYFMASRQPGDPPRSARVTIGFSAPDPDLALAVARDLGELVSQTQTALESEAVALHLESLRGLAEHAAAEAVSRRGELDRATQNVRAQPSERERFRLGQLRGAAESAGQASKTAAMALVDAQLQAREARQIGGLVQVIDPGLPTWHDVPRREKLARQAILSLAVAMSLAVILVGAYYPNVLDEQDLRRAGLRPLGRLPVRRCRSAGAGV